MYRCRDEKNSDFFLSGGATPINLSIGRAWGLSSRVDVHELVHTAFPTTALPWRQDNRSCSHIRQYFPA